MADRTEPVLYILAGPNGVGKSTFYDNALRNEFLDQYLPFLNVDLIAKSLGGYSDVNFAAAQDLYRERVKGYLAQRESFMIESNLAREADYVWLENMRKVGYKLVIYFLNTASLDENIARIQRRVKEGGHNVPEHIARDRYQMCTIYLKTRLSFFDELHFIDNTELTVRRVVTVKQGKLVYVNRPLPGWVVELLSLSDFRHHV